MLRPFGPEAKPDQVDSAKGDVAAGGGEAEEDSLIGALKSPKLPEAGLGAKEVAEVRSSEAPAAAHALLTDCSPSRLERGLK